MSTPPWPDDVELEIRGRLARMEGHQLRQDAVIMDSQAQLQRMHKLLETIDAKLQSLVAALTASTNGRGIHG